MPGWAAPAGSQETEGMGMNEYGIPQNPGQWTSSRLRRWWLHNFYGYNVVRVKHTPQHDFFGRLCINEEYLMSPGDGERRH